MESIKHLSNAELERLFESGCFLIINDLPVGSEFSLDGVGYAIGSKFQGVKFIPAGLHVVSFVPAERVRATEWKQSNSSNQVYERPDVGIGKFLKKGFMRFFQARDVVIMKYDPRSEEFTPQNSCHIEVRMEYLKSLDSNLGAYPLDLHPRWKSLTSFIKPEVVHKVFPRTTKNGDPVLDSSMANRDSDGVEIPLSSKPRVLWGRPRPADELQHLAPHENHLEEENHFTAWPLCDIVRSWPQGCTGAELTQYSRDKSWLLSQFIGCELDNDASQFLGLVQLSFVTFIQFHSVQSFESYQLYINLFTKSNFKTFIEQPVKPSTSEGSPRQGKSGQEEDLTNIDHLRFTLNVIHVLIAQIDFLDSSFFAYLDDSQIENWFFDVFDRARRQLQKIFAWCRHYTRITEGGVKNKRVKLEIVKPLDHMWHEWEKLRTICTKFDWNVKPLHRPSSAALVDHAVREETTNDSEEDSELSSSEDEDSEYKPVVVEPA